MKMGTKIATAAVAAASVGAVGVALAGPATAAPNNTVTQPSSAVHQVQRGTTSQPGQGSMGLTAGTSGSGRATSASQAPTVKTGLRVVHVKTDRSRKDAEPGGKAATNRRDSDRDRVRADKDRVQTAKDRRTDLTRVHRQALEKDTVGRTR